MRGDTIRFQIVKLFTGSIENIQDTINGQNLMDKIAIVMSKIARSDRSKALLLGT